jgi:hypothetical protein
MTLFLIYGRRRMAEKGLTKKDLDQVFKRFEKRKDEKMKTPRREGR